MEAGDIVCLLMVIGAEATLFVASPIALWLAILSILHMQD